MSHGLLDPSTAKSELTQDTIAPPPCARLARMALVATQLAQAENCPSPILFQSMALLFLESLKTCLKQTQSNPPHLLCELLLQAKEAWVAPTKRTGFHLNIWNPCSADAQAVDGRRLNAGAGPGLELPESRPAPPTVLGGFHVAEPSPSPPWLIANTDASSSLCWEAVGWLLSFLGLLFGSLSF